MNRYVYSTTAKQIIRKYSDGSYVKPEDEIVSALDLMLTQDLISIPVVDDNKQIIGDLKRARSQKVTQAITSTKK